MPGSSDYIAYVDESGDHGPTSADYPIFVLAFCLARKTDVSAIIGPALSALKFEFVGHDSIVLHEREIRRAIGAFSFLREKEVRERFLARLTDLIAEVPFTIVAAAIRKDALRATYSKPENPYSLGVQFGLERIARHLESLGDTGTLHVLFERRGAQEDAQLELEFRRVCDGASYLNRSLDMLPAFVPKLACNPGLEIADLVAKPIGDHLLRPDRPNRAWDVVQTKLRRNPSNGSYFGWGLKCFP